MSKKRILIFSAFLLVALASVCYLSISPVKTGVELKGKQSTTTDNIISTPKTNGATKLWNFSTNTEAYGLAVSADGKYMAVGTKNPAKIYYFNTSDHGGKPMWSYETGGYEIYKIAISSNGSYIIAEGYSGSDLRAILLNSTKPTNGPKQEIWNVTYSEISSVDISADGKYIAIGVGEDGVQVYNNSCPSAGGRDKTGDYIWAYDAPEPVKCAAISDDGKYVAAGSEVVKIEGQFDAIYFFNNSIKHYGEYNEQHSYNWSYFDNAHGDYSIDHIAISKDGYYIAGSSSSGIAFLLNASKPISGPKQEKWIVNGSFIAPGVITGVEFNTIDISANGNYIVLGGAATFDESDWSGFVFLYDNQYNSSGGRDKSDEMLWAYPTNESVSTVSISDDGTYIVAGTGYDSTGDDGSPDENTVFLFKNPGKILANPPLNTAIFAYNTSHNVNSVSISSSGAYFAAAGEHGSGMTYLFYYDATTPTLLPAGDDDDDDDGGEPAAIPFGSYYLVFTLVTVVSLVLIYKRKAILNKK